MSNPGAIAKLSIRHEAVLQYLITYPELTHNEVAAKFQVTPAWLSQMIWSDAFQEQLAKRQNECFSSATLGIAEKTAAAANLTLEKLTEKIPECENVDSLSSTADRLLNRLGYGAQKNGGSVENQQNIYLMQANPALVAEAQSRIGRPKNALPEMPAAGKQTLPTEPTKPLNGDQGNKPDAAGNGHFHIGGQKQTPLNGDSNGQAQSREGLEIEGYSTPSLPSEESSRIRETERGSIREEGTPPDGTEVLT